MPFGFSLGPLASPVGLVHQFSVTWSMTFIASVIYLALDNSIHLLKQIVQ
jgi:hypothetical protein